MASKPHIYSLENIVGTYKRTIKTIRNRNDNVDYYTHGPEKGDRQRMTIQPVPATLYKPKNKGQR